MCFLRRGCGEVDIVTAAPVPYFGGKQRIAHQIAALLPVHQHYVEPFAGGLSPHQTEAEAFEEAVMSLW